MNLRHGFKLVCYANLNVSSEIFINPFFFLQLYVHAHAATILSRIMIFTVNNYVYVEECLHVYIYIIVCSLFVYFVRKSSLFSKAARYVAELFLQLLLD